MAEPTFLSDEDYGQLLERREQARLAKEFRLSRTLIGTGVVGAAAGLLAGGPIGILVALAMISTFSAAGIGKRKQTERMKWASISRMDRVRVQRIIDDLVSESGTEPPAVIISPAKSMNAWAMKIFAHRRGTVQVNEGILVLSDPMLRAVLSHELTHYAHCDSRTLIPFSFSKLGISLLQRSMIVYALLTAWGSGILPWVPGVVGAVATAIVSPLFIGSLVAGAVIGSTQNVISRKLERRADAMLPVFTERHADRRKDLALALTVLAQQEFEKAVSRMQVKQDTSPRTSRRTVSSPKSRLRSLRATLHTTDMALTDRIGSFFITNHPPTHERVAHLLEHNTRLVSSATVRRVSTPSGVRNGETYEYVLTVRPRQARMPLRAKVPFLRRTELPGGARTVKAPVAQFRFVSPPVNSAASLSSVSHALD